MEIPLARLRFSSVVPLIASSLDAVAYGPSRKVVHRLSNADFFSKSTTKKQREVARTYEYQFTASYPSLT